MIYRVEGFAQVAEDCNSVLPPIKRRCHVIQEVDEGVQGIGQVQGQSHEIFTNTILSLAKLTYMGSRIFEYAFDFVEISKTNLALTTFANLIFFLLLFLVCSPQCVVYICLSLQNLPQVMTKNSCCSVVSYEKYSAVRYR